MDILWAQMLAMIGFGLGLPTVMLYFHKALD